MDYKKLMLLQICSQLEKYVGRFIIWMIKFILGVNNIE